MTNHPIFRDACPVQVAYTHPTPCEIRSAILRALHADYENPQTPVFPVHVYRIVDEAITAACDGVTQ